MTSSSDSNEYPNSLVFNLSSKFSDVFWTISKASFSIIIPFIKNIKSFSVVEDNVVGADAVTAVKLAVEGGVIKLLVLKKFFLK